MNRARQIIAVTNLKGGTGKTTSAVFLAHVLHERGRQVALVDADPQFSAADWANDAPRGFPFPVIKLATPELYRQLDDVLLASVDAVVIDTPPRDDRVGIVQAALRVATVAVVPVAPVPIEGKRLRDIYQAANAVAGLRHDGRPVPLALLFTRVVPNAGSTATWREAWNAAGFWVLKTEVRRREQYAQAYGDSLRNVSSTPYSDILDELLSKENLK